MYPQNVRESARTLKGLFSFHYYHVTNSIPSISDWCWWMNSRKANVSVILNYPIKVQIWPLLPSRLLLSIIMIVTFVFSLVAGQKDLVSKLVWTPQTGNYHHHCPHSDHWLRWSKIIDNHHQANPSPSDVSACGATSRSSLRERGGQRQEDEDGHGARVAGGQGSDVHGEDDTHIWNDAVIMAVPWLSY